MDSPKIVSPADEDEPLWRYVRLSEFSAPQATPQETVRQGLFGLLRRFTKTSGPDKAELAQEELLQLPPELYRQVVPMPDWATAGASLSATLEDWLTDQPTVGKLQVLLSAPHSGTAEALRQWAISNELTVIDPPDFEELLADSDAWLARLPDNPDGPPWVLPCLERCYLRHAAGLMLLRHLLQHLLTHRYRCLVGCSSWAWTYLTAALKINVFFAQPLTLQAFKKNQLQRWFSQLATRDKADVVVFRQADNGVFVLPPETGADAKASLRQPPDEDGADGEAKLSSFLTELAARSRGNPGIAWAIWRHSLRVEPEKEQAEEASPDSESQQGRTIWVTPWRRVRLPILQAKYGRNELLVLHTLLLHDGLPLDLLIELLPFSPFEVQRIVNHFQHLSVLEEEDVLRVTPLGYPTARDALADEDYPLDNL